MIILSYLFFLSFSRQCRHQVFPKLGQPIVETYYADEGEHICINSTGNNYLNVLFHNSLLSVRYFISPKSNSQSTDDENKKTIVNNFNNNNRLVEAGKFLFPAEKGGVSLPKSDYSSVDIIALVPGNITISTLVFPDECTLGRYVSTEFSSELHISDTFGSFPTNDKKDGEKKQQSVCAWYAQDKYTLQVSISPSQDDKIFVCSSYINCDEPFSRTHQYSEISSNKFVKVVPKTNDFWSDINLMFSADKPSNLFQITGIAKDEENPVPYQLSMKKIENDDENDDDVDNKNIKPDNDNANNDNDGDDEENNADNDKLAFHNKNTLDTFKKNDNRHHKKGRRSNSDSYSNLVIFLSAFVCLFLVCCLVAYLFSQNGPCGKHRSLANDHSEERLLPNNQGYGFFPSYAMPWGQHPPGQGFFNGVFPFGGVPGQPQSPQQQMQYFTSPGSTFQSVPNTTQQDNQNDENAKNENPPQQQVPFQQPMVYIVPPQYQQQFLSQQQYPQNLPQYPQSTPPQQTSPLQQQNQENQEHQT